MSVTDETLSEVQVGKFDLSFSLLDLYWWSGMWCDFSVLTIGDRSLLSFYRTLPGGPIEIDLLFIHFG